jgi:Berberine and berberine like
LWSGGEREGAGSAGFDAAATEADRAWLADSWELVHACGLGGVCANFPDLDLPDEHRAYWSGNLERVRLVKEKYDPEGVFG